MFIKHQSLYLDPLKYPFQFTNNGITFQAMLSVAWELFILSFFISFLWDI